MEPIPCVACLVRYSHHLSFGMALSLSGSSSFCVFCPGGARWQWGNRVHRSLSVSCTPSPCASLLIVSLFVFQQFVQSSDGKVQCLPGMWCLSLCCEFRCISWRSSFVPADTTGSWHGHEFGYLGLWAGSGSIYYGVSLLLFLAGLYLSIFPVPGTASAAKLHAQSSICHLRLGTVIPPHRPNILLRHLVASSGFTQGICLLSTSYGAVSLTVNVFRIRSDGKMAALPIWLYMEDIQLVHVKSQANLVAVGLHQRQFFLKPCSWIGACVICISEGHDHCFSTPRSFASLLRLQNKGSRHMMNRIGDRGSPCLTPWLILICLVSPFPTAKVIVAPWYRSSTTLMI